MFAYFVNIFYSKKIQSDKVAVNTHKSSQSYEIYVGLNLQALENVGLHSLNLEEPSINISCMLPSKISLFFFPVNLILHDALSLNLTSLPKNPASCRKSKEIKMIS